MIFSNMKHYDLMMKVFILVKLLQLRSKRIKAIYQKTLKFNNKSRPKNKEVKDRKRDTFEKAYGLYEGRELTLNALKSGIFPLKTSQGKRLKILTPTQIVQRLSIALA